MANFERMRPLAHDTAEYPELDRLIKELAENLPRTLTPQQRLHLVRDVLVGLTIAELRGHLTAGDEHEFATAALRAHEMGLKK